MFPGGSGPADPAFLAGGGAAGAALRTLDWDGTELGRPADWPPALRAAVTLCLHAAVPIAVFWGPQLRFIFGDAWLPLMGERAPGAMARPGREVWPDIWPLIGPQLHEVMTGTGLGRDEASIPLAAPGGGPAPETWWTYSFSPVLDSSGRHLGVLATVSDVTDAVLTRRRQHAIIELADCFATLHDVDEIVRLGCAAIGRTLGAGRVVRAILDEAAGTANLGGAWSGDAGNGLPPVEGVQPLDEFWAGWTAGPDDRVPVAVDDVRTDPRTASRAALFAQAGVGAFMTAPALVDGRVRMLTVVQNATPRHWRPSDLSFLRDVVSRGGGATARARVEAALRESDTRNRHSVELSPLFMWTAGPDGRLNHLDERLIARTGVPGLGDGWLEALHPDDRARSAASWSAAVATGERYDVQHRIHVRGDELHAEGYRWMRSRANPQREGSGRIVMWYGSTEDVDDARQAQLKLAASEARLRAMTDSIDQMIWSTLPDGSVDYYNQAWYDHTGALPASMGEGSADGDDWWHVVHPDDQEPARAAWRRSMRTGQPYRLEYRLRHRSGAYRWVLARAHPVRDADGRIERWYGTCTDMEEIVEAREVLARSRVELESLVAQTAADRERMWRLSTDLMAILRGDGTVTAVNPAWERVLGWTPNELVGRTLDNLLHPDDRRTTIAAIRRLRHGRPVPPAENRFLGRDGAWRVLSWTAVAEGGLIHAIGRDNTAEREAAAQLDAARDTLRQAQKMEAVGQLTGGIAHDFNNMLAVVIGSLDLLGRRLDPGDARAARYVDNAMAGARRAAGLTRGLLAFARQQSLSPVVLDLRELLDGMEAWLRSSLGATIRVELAHAADVWPVLADRNQLENAVLNLAVNARDAMPDGGTLRIEASNVVVAPGEAVPAAGGHVAPGEHVRLAVADNGGGIPPGVIDRVFDPFFTTKDVGKGTGLGLSQVYGFVAQSGGHVGLRSAEGQGTTVVIHLPRYQATTERQDAPAPSPARSEPATGHRPDCAVLVVDDEPAVRRVTADAVTELGYRVLEADGAAAALAVLETAQDVRLLLTDIVMPDTSGRALAAEAVRRRPGLKVLFASGFARAGDGDGGGEALNGPEGATLSKPFTVEELAAAMRDALR